MVATSEYRALASLVLGHASLLGKESVSVHPSDQGRAALQTRYQPSSTAATPPAQLLPSDMEPMFDDGNKIAHFSAKPSSAGGLIIKTFCQ